MLNPPPLHLREKILTDYYNNLNRMDYTDAHVAYHNSMHILYCKYNPHLKYTTLKNGKRVLQRLKTREDFAPKTDRFGAPLWIYDLTEEELMSDMDYPEILAKRKAKKKSDQ